jgi:hypothetical protein
LAVEDLFKNQEPWWGLYKAAVLETNWEKLEDRINAAENAIMKRSSLDGDVSPDERVALEDSRNGLRVLKQEYRDSLSRGE